MAIILNIDTAVGNASICLSRNGVLSGEKKSERINDQAAWLHEGIRDLCAEDKITIEDIEAIAVSIGPGSYTGLRIGLATAKGLCYARKIPLLTIHTLLLMACAAKNEEADWIIPLIDARRMEVFAAVFDNAAREVIPPAAMILEKSSFASQLETGKVLFTGNGSEKLKKLIEHPNASFSAKQATAADMCVLSDELYKRKEWADLVYTEPFYLKDFYTPAN